jgi:hypothetical protein
MNYKIMGNIINIEVDDIDVRQVLIDEFKIYDEVREQADVNVYVVNTINFEGVYSNTPSIHKTFKNGFLADFGGNKVLYKKEDVLSIYIEMNKKRSFLRKFISMGYKNNIDNIGQVLHELIFVPLNFFIENKTIIHSSSMKNTKTGKSVMIGGTGGVGKTSMELLLCRDFDYSFISDDIAVVDDKCSIYPNLAFPKIYAYNLADNESLKNLIFKDRYFMDKFQWGFIKKFRGESKVRRVVSPDVLYKNFETNENDIDDYFILYKSNNVNEITISELSAKKASALTLDIIKNEYHSVFQHITWHEYNCELMNFEPIIKLEDTLVRWLEIYNKIFQSVNCFAIKIPVGIKHDQFISEMKKAFNNG